MDMIEYLKGVDSFEGFKFNISDTAMLPVVIEFFMKESRGNNLLNIFLEIYKIKERMIKDPECKNMVIGGDVRIVNIAVNNLSIRQQGIIKRLLSHGVYSLRGYILECIENYRADTSYIHRRKTANSELANQTLRREVFKRFSYECAICQSRHNLAIDHIVSVKGGGSNDIENLQVLCKSCNSSKGAK